MLSKSARKIYEMIFAMNRAEKILPDPDSIMKAFTYFLPQETKVIIIGQDPYPNAIDAMGLAFSTKSDDKPASLKNIFEEMQNDLGPSWEWPQTGNLEPWAKQGVLLLNSVLTVNEGKPGSHAGLGWEEFTTSAIQRVLDNGQPIVLIAWGNYAKDKLKSLKLHDKVLVLEGAHPSPLSASNGFFGGRYFSKTNEFLKQNGVKEIEWKI